MRNTEANRFFGIRTRTGFVTWIQWQEVKRTVVLEKRGAALANLGLYRVASESIIQRGRCRFHGNASREPITASGGSLLAMFFFFCSAAFLFAGALRTDPRTDPRLEATERQPPPHSFNRSKGRRRHIQFTIELSVVIRNCELFT